MKRTEQIVNVHFGDWYRIGLGSRQKNVVGLAIIHDLVVEEVGLHRLLVRGLGRCQSEVEDMFEGAFVTDASVWCLRINREGGWGILDRHADFTGSFNGIFCLRVSCRVQD